MKPRGTALLLALAFVLIGLVLWSSPWRWLGALSAAAGVALAGYVLLRRLR